MKLPQPPKRRPDYVKRVYSGYFLTQSSFPKRRKTRNCATGFLEFLTTFPECIRTNVNQMRIVQLAGLTDLENQIEQEDFPSCHPVDLKIAIDCLLLKENSKMKVWKAATELKVQNVLYH